MCIEGSHPNVTNHTLLRKMTFKLNQKFKKSLTAKEPNFTKLSESFAKDLSINKIE